MHTLAMILAVWLGVSVLFGLAWILTAFALKEARRRWPHVAVDPKWRRNRLGPYANRRNRSD